MAARKDERDVNEDDADHAREPVDEEPPEEDAGCAAVAERREHEEAHGPEDEAGEQRDGLMEIRKGGLDADTLVATRGFEVDERVGLEALGQEAKLGRSAGAQAVDPYRIGELRETRRQLAHPPLAEGGPQ